MVHPAVDDRIVHAVAHRQPIDGQVNLLDRRQHCDARIVRYDDEVEVKRQPAHGEYQHDDHHHFDHLKYCMEYSNKCFRQTYPTQGYDFTQF